MIRIGIESVRRSMYRPIDLAYDAGVELPLWLLRLVVKLDAPLLAVLMPDKGCRGRRP